MLFRFKYSVNVLKRSHFSTLPSFHRHKLNMEVDRFAYFHLLNGAERFKVGFLFVNEAISINRQFNFERVTTETIDSFLARVMTNLEKYIKPKLKKKRKKLGSDEEEENVNIVVELESSDGSSVPGNATCQDVFFSGKYSPGTLTLRMMGLDYIAAVNYPWVDTIKLPSSMMSGFPVYPHCFETKFTDRSLSKFVWMKPLLKSALSPPEEGKVNKNKQDIEWTEIGNGFMYTPKNADIGHKLKIQCTPKNHSTTGPIVEHESASIVEAGPGCCPFEERHLFTEQHTQKGSFRVVSYNILADVYSSTDTAQNELFNYCPTYALNIDYRKQLFLKELLGYNADLVCLQEVDTKVFNSDLLPVLGEQGLVGVHCKKSTIREGVCSFYSPSKFRLRDKEEVVLSQELLTKDYCSHIRDRVQANEQLKNRITGLGTAAQALILESVEKPGEVIVLGNTHLYFHPDADHIRLLQGGIIMAFLNNIVENLKIKNKEDAVSLMCCGDFNSVPECGIYQLMTTKSVPADYKDWTSKPEEEVKGLSLSQSYNIQSACGTPSYTNYTVSFAACLDYIYYQTDRLAVDMVVPLPSDDILREHRAIPSVVFPSDHVALIADLIWKK